MIPNCEQIHSFCLSAERMRVMGTPTAVAVCRKVLLNGKITKVNAQDDPILNERSIRRTIRTMVRLGLIRYEPWKSTGELILTRTAIKMYRAGGHRC